MPEVDSPLDVRYFPALVLMLVPYLVAPVPIVLGICALLVPFFLVVVAIHVQVSYLLLPIIRRNVIDLMLLL